VLLGALLSVRLVWIGGVPLTNGGLKPLGELENLLLTVIALSVKNLAKLLEE